MRKAPALLILPALFLLLAAPLVAQGLGDSSANFEGALVLPAGPTPLSLRLLEDGGGLIDLPGQGIYGYPLSALEASQDSLRFSVGLPGDASGWFSFELRKAPGAGPGQTGRFQGRFKGSGGSGEAWLSPVSSPPRPGEALAIPVKGGRLHGELLFPAGSGPFPLLIIVPGSGTTDRDGNNYAVPGRNDAYLQLAQALAQAGVASFRYDKRGAGESYTLAGPEAESRFDDYIDDAQAVVRTLAGDPRFSRVSLAGHTEGALVAASALGRLDSGLGLALLGATGLRAVDLVEASLAELPSDKAEEAQAIMASLKAGNPWPEPSEFFADFFRPSFQAYLISWFKTDLVAELAALDGPILLVQGNRDFQVPLSEFALLAEARPDAPAVVLPGMNHMLKEVPGELEENWKAFSDPGFPLAEGLVDLLAAWAKRQALPGGLVRFDGGKLEGRGGPEAQTGPALEAGPLHSKAAPDEAAPAPVETAPGPPA